MVQRCDGFNGTWKSTYEGGTNDVFNIIVNGNSGTYEGGSLSGTIAGNVFTGKYKETKESGTFKFTLASDGDSFVGQYVVDGGGGNGNWRGSCVSNS